VIEKASFDVDESQHIPFSASVSGFLWCARNAFRRRSKCPYVVSNDVAGSSGAIGVVANERVCARAI
jgi:hypothetical protein